MVSSVQLGQASLQEATLASAATTDLGSAPNWKVSISGTATITSFGTGAHRFKALYFSGALTLTYNATSLILPGAADITTAAGDTCLATSDGSGNWRVRAYQRASGKPIAGPASTDISDATTIGKALLTASSLTPHGILLGEGSSAPAVSAAMTNGQLLVGQTGADPLPKTISGDATISAAGALTFASIGGQAVSIGGAFALSGAFGLTLNVTATTSLTLPTSGTLATVSGALGTPTSVTLTNANGLPIASGVSGLGAHVAAALAVAGGSAFPSILGQSHIPLVAVSSGTMGNNGALSGITAVQRTYPNAYVYLPAGAISSGSAAGWYYAVFSSTTAATVYNNTYTSGTPAIPGSPTAFVTTGPGSFTQIVSAIIAYQLTIPGNTIGPNGSIRVSFLETNNNSANSKFVGVGYGNPGGSGLAIAEPNWTTTTVGNDVVGFCNAGVTNIQSQLVNTKGTAGALAGASAPAYAAIDSTSSQTLWTFFFLSAGDTIALENIVVELLPGG